MAKVKPEIICYTSTSATVTTVQHGRKARSADPHPNHSNSRPDRVVHEIIPHDAVRIELFRNFLER
jgi:hypothetical protein